MTRPSMALASAAVPNLACWASAPVDIATAATDAAAILNVRSIGVLLVAAPLLACGERFVALSLLRPPDFMGLERRRVRSMRPSSHGGKILPGGHPLGASRGRASPPRRGMCV